MRNSLISAAAAVWALFGLADSALAQGVLAAPPPSHYTLDARGVDLISGAFSYGSADVVIGQPGQGGLTYSRTFVGYGWRSNLMGTVAYTGSTYYVSFGGYSDVFTLSGSTYTPKTDRGQTLTKSGTTFTYTAPDGTVATFQPHTLNYQNQLPDQNGGVVRTITYPDGEVQTFTYVRGRVLMPADPPNPPYYLTTYRLQSVANTLGYHLKLEYANNAPTNEDELGDFNTLTKVTGFNQTVDWCDPAAVTCTFSRTWPSATYGANSVTDELGRTTVLTESSNGLTGIRWPSTSSGNDIAIAYASGKVSSVTVGSDVWDYTYVDASGVRTTTVEDPLNNDTVVVSTLSTGRPNSSTDPLGRQTEFTWDSQGRLTRTTLPLDNYVEYTYGARGNVTTVTTVESPTSPSVPDIVTSASYPSACTGTGLSQKNCNRPLTTTDALGNVTDYSWSDTHGGLLSVTQPAPSLGADRPQTRYTYSSLYAWYRNSASATVYQAPSAVQRMTEVSACIAGTSCNGTTSETQSVVTYGSSGVANNLLTTAVASGDGSGALTATVNLTYTPNGDVETAWGPVTGSGDYIRYRYDDGRQLVGVIGPDPDAAGAGLHRAVRLTYNANGQTTLQEQGTVTSQSDGAWAAFNSLNQVEMTYDTIGRPVRSDLKNGGTIYTVNQTSYDANGRIDCVAARMNPAVFGSLPASACSAGTPGYFGPDRIVDYAYDAASQLVSSTTGGTGDTITESVTYTDNGLPESLTDGNGNVSVLEYDGFDRLLKLRYPNATCCTTSTTDFVQYGYNANSRVTSYRDRAKQTSTTTYDALSRPTDFTPPTGYTQTLAYDNLGRVTGLSGISPVAWNMAWTYDALGRQLTQGGAFGGMTLTSQYDLAGRRTSLTWPDNESVTYVRNTYGAVIDIRLNITASVSAYTYDNLGRLTGIARGNGTSTSFGYDDVSRLTSFSQDPAGTANDLTVSLSYNPVGQIYGRVVSNSSYISAPVTGTTEYANNGLNQVTAQGAASVTYDAAGNMTGGFAKTLGYDDQNNLVAASGTTTWLHDPMGRIYNEVTSGTTTRFAYDGMKLATEYSGSSGTTIAARHIPGLWMDDTALSYSGSGTSTPSWPLVDERGSVIALTNGSGSVTAINSYDEYGVPASGNLGRFQYTGQVELPSGGLYDYKRRAYVPDAGRFGQADPIGYAAGANIYGYVRGDPTNQTDPTGECPWCLGAAIGGAIGGGVEIYRQWREFGTVSDPGRVFVQTGVGALAGATGVGAASWAARAVSPVLSGAFGGAVGGSLGNGTSAALTNRWSGGTLGSVSRAGLEGAFQGAYLGAVSGGLAGGVTARFGPQFSRVDPGFRPIVTEISRPSPFAGEIGGFGGSVISGVLQGAFGSSFDVAAFWADRGCAFTGYAVINGRTYSYCGGRNGGGEIGELTYED